MQRAVVWLATTVGAFAVLPTAHADSPPAQPAANQAQPPVPPPDVVPPWPVPANPPPPVAQPIQAPPQGVVTPALAPQPPQGQWVYTQQYGWLWLPYGQAYTHVVDNAALAYEYAFYPSYGWRWVVAPWVLGFGVAPYWGGLGPQRFAWYAHPWFRVGTAHLRPSWGHVAGPAFGRGHAGIRHRR